MSDLGEALESERRESRNLTSLVGVRLLPAEYEQAQAEARRYGLTVPALLRRLLQEHLRA